MTPILLASMTDPSAVEVASVVAVLFFLIAGYNQIRKALSWEKEKPSPGEVRSESLGKFAGKDEFREHVSRNQMEHDNIFKKIGGVERGGKDHATMQTGELRSKMGELGERVAGLETETKNQNAWLSRMDDKLDQIISKQND